METLVPIDHCDLDKEGRGYKKDERPDSDSTRQTQDLHENMKTRGKPLLRREPLDGATH